VLYVCRMWTLHLPDVWSLINRPDFHRLIDHLKQRDPELPEHAEALRRALNREPLQKLVAHFRNKFAGHPDPDEFQRALALTLTQDHLMDVSTVIPPLGSHFNVTDRLFAMILFQQSGAQYSRLGRPGAYDEEAAVKTLLGELVEAQVALSNLVYHLVVGMYLDADL